MKKIILTFLGGLLLVFATANIPHKIYYAKAQEPLKSPTIAQEAYINALIWCESQGHDKVRIVDSNGLYSYGLMQFQLGTFMYYGTKYQILKKDITEDEARNLIYSPELQKRIAFEMLNDDLAYHWKNCSRQIRGKYPKSDI